MISYERNYQYQPDSSEDKSGFLLPKNMRGACRVLTWLENEPKRMKKRKVKTRFVLIQNESGYWSDA